MHSLAYLIFGSMLIFRTDTATPVFTTPATNGAACPDVGTIPENTDGATYTTTIVTAATSAISTFALVGTDAAKFSVVAATGVVTVATTPNIDYEALTNKYLTVEIEFSDFYIYTTDTATPVFTTPATNGAACPDVGTIPENTDGATYTTTIVTAATSAISTFALVGTDAAKFSVVAATGVVTVATTPNIDYEALTNKYLTVEIEATDSGDGTSKATATCTVAITDVVPTWSANVSPYFIRVSKDIPATTALGDFSCLEGTTALETAHTYFDISGNNLQTKAGADLTGQSAGTSFTVTVTCSDTTITISKMVTMCIDSFDCGSGAINLSGISSALVALVLYFMHKLF